MKKLNILIGCLFFRNYTGSEMYVFELSKQLKLLGHSVSIISPNTDGPLVNDSEILGLKVYNFNSPPKNIKFDIIHSQHQPVIQRLLNLYPNTLMICTIHSEVIPVEYPIIHPNIKKYIAIRPEIKNFIIKNFFPIVDSKVNIIYNPIDNDRFNKIDCKDDGYVLFVGTIDELRKDTIFNLVDYTKSIGKDFFIVGKNHSNYLNLLLTNKNVKYFQETKNVEKFVKNCSETSGILLGRTTIEGWLCNKPGWIYNIDTKGKILNKQIHQVPNNLENFFSDKVAIQIESEYYKILSK